MDDLRVIYEDDDLIVVDKPSGLRTQPGLENGPRRGEWTDEDRDSAYGRWHGGSKQSRHEFWQAAVDGMYAKLREDGSASHLEVRPILACPATPTAQQRLSSKECPGCLQLAALAFAPVTL
jgi:hypothetical protein